MCNNIVTVFQLDNDGYLARHLNLITDFVAFMQVNSIVCEITTVFN